MQEIFHFLLQQTINRSGLSVPEIAKKLKRQRSWLYRLLNGTRPIRLEHIEEIYAALGRPITEFFAACLEKLNNPHFAAKSDLATNPAALLRILRGESDPDLDWLGQFRTHRVSQPRSAESYPLHKNVRRIDDAREFDLQAALVDSEKWLRSFERRCKRRRISAQETSQLATALGVWASIQRASGHQALSLKVLELAWELHGEHPSLASTGDLLERSSMAVYEHGYPLLAVPLMQRAFAIASARDCSFDQARTLLGMGLLTYRSGNPNDARSMLERVLKHPGADTFRIAGASSYLAVGYERERKLEEAQATLDDLAAIVPSLPKKMQHSLLGIRVRIQRNSGNLLAAKETYEQLYLEAQPLFGPLDRTAILLEWAEILVELEDAVGLRNLARHLPGLMEGLEQTPLIRSLLAELLSTIRRGEQFSVDRILRIRNAVAEEASTTNLSSRQAR